MSKLTLTEEQMVENLHLAAEEMILQCFVLNRRGIVQAHINIHGHTHTTDIRIMPADTEWQADIKVPDPLARIDIRLAFPGWFDEEGRSEEYLERMAEIETFVRYLDHLIAMNKPIPVNHQEAVA